MRKNMNTKFLVVLVAAVIVALTFTQMYHVREDTAGQLLWKGDRAYLFMSSARRGYHFKYLEYPWVIFKEYLRAPPIPNDQRRTLDVIRITPNTLERHVIEVEGNTPDLLTPFEGHIFANCEGTLCKWNETRFEPATEEEGRSLNGISKLSAIGFSDIDGWSKRRIDATTDGFQFSVELSKQVTLLVKQGNVYRSPYDSSTIDLLRPGQPPEKLWHVDGNPRWVSKNEYERTFEKH
jgi:hypothetical protein